MSSYPFAQHTGGRGGMLRWGPFLLYQNSEELVLGSTTGEEDFGRGGGRGDLGGMGHARAAPSGASISSSGWKQWRQHFFYAGEVVCQQV